MNVNCIVIYLDKDRKKYCFSCAVKNAHLKKIRSEVWFDTDYDIWQHCEICKIEIGRP